MSELDVNTSKMDCFIAEICSKQKLTRDASISKLIKECNIISPSANRYIVSQILNMISKPNLEWETYHGLLETSNSMLLNNIETLVQKDALSTLQNACLSLLSHEEVRVRQSAGKLLGSLCKFNNGKTYEESKDQVLNLIRLHAQRELIETEEEMKKSQGMSKAQIFHDTAGWKNLETSMKCLEAMVIGCGAHFAAHINKDLLELIFSSLSHTNRFVRETGYSLCAAIVCCETTGAAPDQIQIQKYGSEISAYLGSGLADNWSQVRLAASVATRNFLLSMPLSSRTAFFPVLLPRICLNRFYVAEGVKLYSQETWLKVTELTGAQYVEENINSMVAYYVEATQADNHAVREAACSSIAELAKKIESVEAHQDTLLSSLIECFKDDSWPVRDAACIACGNFVTSCSKKCPERMASLYPFFFKNLEDSIPSVREGAAVALGSIVAIEDYQVEAMQESKAFIQQAFEGFTNQPEDSVKYGNLDTGPAVYGVAKKKKDNDIDLHSDNQLYSCGSLAPKMGRGGGGCSDCRFQRPSQPWEKVDGSVYLISHLSSLDYCRSYVVDKLPSIADACAKKNYSAHFSFLETVCKCLPRMGRGLGKQLFKQHLHLFYDSIFYSLRSQNALTATAAATCLQEIAQFIGPNILKGRLEQHDSRYLQEYNDSPLINAKNVKY